MSLRHLEIVFNEEPFNLKENKEGYLLARYIIEDNTEPLVDIDPERTNNISIVESIFRRLLGKFHIYTVQEEEELMNGALDVQIYSESPP